MKPSEAKSSTKNRTGAQSHVPSFAKVFDGRKQPIRGLWVRNGRYYAQLIENTITGVKKTKSLARIFHLLWLDSISIGIAAIGECAFVIFCRSLKPKI
jgi:hypothetical protein